MNLAPQLPTVLGAFSAMLVAFLSLLNGTSPTTCLMKSFAAFLVFSGLGLILRYALLAGSENDINDRQDPEKTGRDSASGKNSLDVIVPGTSVADLLGSPSANNTAGNSTGSGEAETQAA